MSSLFVVAQSLHLNDFINCCDTSNRNIIFMGLFVDNKH
uniref:Uncharacterized protein n=1 Tax=Anguilla anguilla TaxID=7936 RepID=A0A0E9S0C2_ANGAN